MDKFINDVDILLVEDNQTDAELAIRALKKSILSDKLLWVKDGAEALDFLFATGDFSGCLLTHAPKVIFLDLRLPKVDGLEVLRRIKNDERTRTIPVVMLTSSNEDRDVVESYHLGVNSYICKPVDFDEFVKVVSQLGLYWLLVNHRRLQ